MCNSRGRKFARAERGPSLLCTPHVWSSPALTAMKLPAGGLVWPSPSIVPAGDGAIALQPARVETAVLFLLARSEQRGAAAYEPHSNKPRAHSHDEAVIAGAVWSPSDGAHHEFLLLIESFFACDEEGTKHIVFHWRTSYAGGPPASVYCLSNGQVAKQTSHDYFEFDRDGTPTRLERSR